jgi:hypothetical protein
MRAPMGDPDRPPRPGLVKARAAPLVARKTLSLASMTPGRWRELFEAADVISEGAGLVEGAGVVYYGTTSLVILASSRGGALPDAELATLAALVRLDPHARVRALRVAHREALSRAGRPLGTLRAEIAVAAARGGLEVVVDVVADVLGARGARVPGS